MGLHTSIVYVDAGDARIEWTVFLLAEDKISRYLASKKPYSKGRKEGKFVIDTSLAGSRPQRKGNHAYRIKLPTYDVPKETRDMVESNQIPEEEDIRTNDMECITWRKKGNRLLSLEVPGLAERRPPLVYGDFIFAKLSSEHDNDNMTATSSTMRNSRSWHVPNQEAPPDPHRRRKILASD